MAAPVSTGIAVVIMATRDFERELRDLVLDILRAHRNRDPETQAEIEPAVQRLEMVAAAVLPPIQDLIATAVTALNAETHSGVAQE